MSARPRHPWNLEIAAMLAIGAAFLSPAAGAAATKPAAAVTYREWGADGPYLGAPRTLTTRGNARFGIDQYSRLRIEIDRDTLRRALIEAIGDSLSNPRAKTLLVRIAHLRDATLGLADAARSAERSAKLFSQAPSPAEVELMSVAVGESESRVSAILGALREARRARLAEAGRDAAGIRRELNQTMDPIYDIESPAYRFGYDWGVIASLLQQELSAAAGDLDSLKGTGLVVEIQAHAVRPDGEEFALALPGYNSEKTGPLRPVQRHHFEAAPEEKDLFAKYEQMAKDVGDARSAGDALLRALRAELPALDADFRALADTVRATLRGSEQQVRDLAAWGDAARLKKWFTDRRGDAASVPAVTATLDSLEGIVGEAAADLAALRAIADFGASLGASAPPDAIPRLVDALARLPLESLARVLDPAVWRRRVERASAALQQLQAAPPQLKARIRAADGPVAAYESARASLEKLAAVIGSAPARLRPWLASLGFVPQAEAASSLSLPAGQKRLAIDAEINTEFNLRTVRQSIHGDETVRVDYAFFQGDRPIAGAFDDEFLLGDYGWTSHVVAGLTFTQQIRAGADLWRPTANMSWVAHHRSWPKHGEQGLYRRPGPLDFGVGVSSMSLDYDAAQSTELGLASVFTWFEDRAQVGVGYDLQARHDPYFWFFSLRLIQGPGGIGGPPKK
jgi:hypothetical protein